MKNFFRKLFGMNTLQWTPASFASSDPNLKHDDELLLKISWGRNKIGYYNNILGIFEPNNKSKMIVNVISYINLTKNEI